MSCSPKQTSRRMRRTRDCLPISPSRHCPHPEVDFRARMPSARAANPYISVTLDRIDLDRGGRAVLRAVSWRIRPGQRWLLIGGNGAGKTQLLKLISGAVWPTPDRGSRRYRLHGESFDSPAGVAEEIAYVGAERQDRYEHYEWNFRVREVVGTGLHRTDIPMRALTPAEERRVAALLRRLGIRSEEHTSELQSRRDLVCRLLLEKKK